MWNLKKKKDKLIYKTEIDPQTQKTNLWLPRRKGRGGINQEVEINIYIILYIKQITNKELLHNTGNYSPYFLITNKRKESENEYIYIHTHTYIYTHTHI